ncbi:MAG: Neopullulanase, partial [Labilithrix sp.]|nr:Neopullulanase [Labilithrix sp.]
NTLWLSPLYKNPEGEFPGTDGHSYTSYHGYWPTASRVLDPRA